MAKADYNVADRAEVTENGGPLTALDRVNQTVAETPDAENQAEALAAGVKDAAFIGYDVALDAHGAREDIEDLDSYTRRTYGIGGADFANQAHMRQLPNRSGGNGIAPDPDNAVVVDGASAPGSSSV